jgi:hypothetical protein
MSEVNVSPLEVVLSSLADWSEKYQKVLDTPPDTGDILTPIEGNAILIVEAQEGKPPFIYGKAYVPEIPDVEPRWYLQSTDQRTQHGWKVILMAKARAGLIKRIGLSGGTVTVKSLRIVKQSQSGKSLLAEVAEYCDE